METRPPELSNGRGTVHVLQKSTEFGAIALEVAFTKTPNCVIGTGMKRAVEGARKKISHAAHILFERRRELGESDGTVLIHQLIQLAYAQCIEDLRLIIGQRMGGRSSLSAKLLSLKCFSLIEMCVCPEEVHRLDDGLDGVVQPTLIREDQDLLGLPQAIVNANK